MAIRREGIMVRLKQASGVAAKERTVGPSEPVGDLIQVAIGRARARLKASASLAVQGDSKAVHEMRTGARRLRSELRAFRPALNTDWAQGLANELRELAGMLGAVRDLDVL